MKQSIRAGISSLLIFTLITVTAQAASAAVLRFDPESVTVTSGNTFDVDIIVDPQGEEIAGTDAYLLYDNTLVEFVSFEAGTYFPLVVDQVENEYVSLSGIITEPTNYRTDSGVMGTVTFSMLSDNSGELSFYCDITQNDTSKIVKSDENATNIIECDQMTAFAINGGDVPAADPTATPVPQQPEAPTITPIPGVKQSAQPTVLPESGVFENVVTVAVPGAVMLALGVMLKLFI